MPTYTKTMTDVQVRSVELGGTNEITTTVAVRRLDNAFIDIDTEMDATDIGRILRGAMMPIERRPGHRCSRCSWRSLR